jgi:hypothetical protein
MFPRIRIGVTVFPRWPDGHKDAEIGRQLEHPERGGYHVYMVSIVLAALALAGVIVLAAKGASGRRALAADVRALRAELKRTREAVSARRTDGTSPGARGAPRQHGADHAVASHDDPSHGSRGRTLH